MLHKSSFLIEAAVANQSGAMEADTISKNGRRSKSQMSRVNFLITLCFALLATSIIFSGCNNEINKDADEYIEIIKKAGFEGKRTDPFKLAQILIKPEVRAKGVLIRQKYSDEDFSKFGEIFEKKFRKEFEYSDEEKISLLMLQLFRSE